MMNRYLLIAVLTFLLSPCFGQQPQIAEIRKAVAAINADTAYVQVRLDNESYLEEMTDRGGYLMGLYKKDQLKKMISWIGYSNSIAITEYYFQNGQLIFVYDLLKAFAYDEKKQQLDEDRTNITYEGRYYYQNGKKIDAKVTGTVPKGTATDWVQMVKQLEPLVESVRKTP
ncbi:hypothetical protein MKQ68_24585 [Chitinophaga horti]|uniref:DUF4468 domain-containing protein n=1 Tax=Chitinophaga horti TaxID=2920382 RepID=A0ABY6J507_9BACT|nr:hypothetical protein [Chitinophaga horti]UYQ93264.1 hypothetical protein MKQ68_24585 [Chitinophaga horti]